VLTDVGFGRAAHPMTMSISDILIRVPPGSGQPPMIIKATVGGRRGKKNPE